MFAQNLSPSLYITRFISHFLTGIQNMGHVKYNQCEMIETFVKELFSPRDLPVILSALI